VIQYYPQATVIPTVFLAAQPRVAGHFALAASARSTFTVSAEVNHG
jgi:hypothetical protein